MENIDFNWGSNKEVPPTNNSSTANGSDKTISSDKEKSPFSTTTNMLVSGILHRGEEKSVCVMITDKNKSAEIRLTKGLRGELLTSQDYSQSELEDIIDYLDSHIDEVIATAKEINPMKAFMS